MDVEALEDELPDDDGVWEEVVGPDDNKQEEPVYKQDNSTYDNTPVADLVYLQLEVFHKRKHILNI